jgi:hypothetical protein
MIPDKKELNNSSRVNWVEILWLSVYFLLLLPSSLVVDAHSGIDPSWQISLELASKNHFIFGKDFSFTYGPWGFLITKLAIAHSKWFILLYEIMVISYTVYLLRHFLKPFHYSFYICTAVLLSLFTATGYSCETLVMPIYVLSLYLFIKEQNKFAFFMAIVLSVISFYMKVNYGIVLIVLLYGTILVAAIMRTAGIIQLLGGILLHICILFLLSGILNVSLWSYIQFSLQLIDAYNDAMFTYIEVYDIKFITAMIIVCLYPLGFILHRNYYFTDFWALYFYLFNGIFLYLLFKNGFVRADGHVFGFFTGVSVIFGTAYLFAAKDYRMNWAILFIASLTLSSFILIRDHYKTNMLIDKIAINQYCQDILLDVSSKNIIEDHERPLYKVSPEIVAKIGKGSVDIMPYEISEIYYYNLNYNPRPVPQSYSVYNEKLDLKSTEKYTSATAPDYVIYDNISINQRHPFWDESITKRTLLTHYYLVHGDSSMVRSLEFDEENYLRIYPDIKDCVAKGIFKSGYEHFSLFTGRNENRLMNDSSTNVYLLFKKRETPLKQKIVKEKELVIEIGKEYPIEASVNPQYLYANIEYNLFGKVKRLFFQPSPIDIILYCEDGTSQRFPALVPIMKTGVLINKKTDTRAESLMFYLDKGKNNKNITKIKFVANHGYKDTIKVTFREIAFE